MTDDTRKNYPHYHKDVAHLQYVDVYRVLDLFGVTNPAIQHAVKKLLVAGGRGAKDVEKDLREAVVSINRALQMIAEDAQPKFYPLEPFKGPGVVGKIVCTNCDTEVPPGCGGANKDDGRACALNAGQSTDKRPTLLQQEPNG